MQLVASRYRHRQTRNRKELGLSAKDRDAGAVACWNLEGPEEEQYVFAELGEESVGFGVRVRLS